MDQSSIRLASTPTVELSGENLKKYLVEKYEDIQSTENFLSILEILKTQRNISEQSSAWYFFIAALVYFQLADTLEPGYDAEEVAIGFFYDTFNDVHVRIGRRRIIGYNYTERELRGIASLYKDQVKGLALWIQENAITKPST